MFILEIAGYVLLFSGVVVLMALDRLTLLAGMLSVGKVDSLIAATKIIAPSNIPNVKIKYFFIGRIVVCLKRFVNQ